MAHFPAKKVKIRMRKPLRLLLEITGLKPLVKFTKAGLNGLQRMVARGLQRFTFSSEYLGPPKGITRVSELCREKVAYREIFPESVRQQPVQRFVAAGGTLQRTADSEFISSTLLPSYVVTLEGGRVYGPNGLVITREDHVIDETTGSFRGAPKPHPIFNAIKLPSVTKVPGRLAAVGYNYAHGYYHWMLEILPRFEILRRAGLQYDHLYMNPITTRFQAETLPAVGLNESHAIWASERTHLKAEQLIVPSLPAAPGQIPHWVCQFLRERFLPADSRKGKERLLVSRRKAARRRVLNEKHLRKALEAYGFREVMLEDCSIADQARLFASAETIVATHGAALTNLVFCHPGTSVVELFASTRTYNNYQVLSHLMDLPYHGLLTSPEGLSRTSMRKQDLLVDVPALVRYLDQVEII